MQRVIAVLIGLIVVAAACSSGGDTVVGTTATADVTSSTSDYMEAVGTPLSLILVASSRTTDSVEVAFLAEGVDGGLAAADDSLDELLAVFDEQAAAIEAITPPDDYDDSHAALTDGIGEIRDAVVAQQTAARDGDLEAFQAAVVRADQLQAGLQREGPPELQVTSASAATLSAGLGELSGEEVDYLVNLAAAKAEFGTAQNEFSQSVNRSYQTTDEMLQALLDAGAGAAFVPYQQDVLELDPPARFAEDHEAVAAYLEDVLAIDAGIAEAAADRDVVGFVIGNEELRGAAVTLDEQTSTQVQFALGGPETRITPTDLPAGDDGLLLWTILGDFDRRYGAEGRFDYFGPLTDEQRARATVAVVPLLSPAIAATQASLADLALDGNLAADVAILRSHFDNVAGIHTDIAGAADAGDWTGVEEGVARLRTTWCTTGDELSAGAAPIAVIHFAGATVDPACGPR